MSLSTFAPVLDAVRGLTWPALHRVHSALPGPHLSRVRGATVEFIEHRSYRQGDETRRIDWKLVARTDRVYIRLSQERAVQPTMLLLDATASMAFPAPGLDKWRYAQSLTIALASVARYAGDPVGLLLSAESPVVVEPRTRRTVLDEMMRVVNVLPAGATALAPAFAEAQRRCRRVVLVTDFLGDADALLRAGRAFAAAGNEVYAVHVVAQDELHPDPKNLLVEDPEQPLLRRPMPASARAAYERNFAAWRQQLARDWRTAGGVYVMCVPNQESIRRTVRRITMGTHTSRVVR